MRHTEPLLQYANEQLMSDVNDMFAAIKLCIISGTYGGAPTASEMDALMHRVMRELRKDNRPHRVFVREG